MITKYIVYDQTRNSWRSINGYKIANIHSLLTPNDILLFKSDHKNNQFPHRDDKRMNIEILVRGEEDMKESKPLQDFSHGAPEIKDVHVEMIIRVDTLGLTFDRVMESYGDYTLNELRERFHVHGYIKEGE